MDSAAAPRSIVPGERQPWQPSLTMRLAEAGTSAGVNIHPGSGDDGWTVAPIVSLADGTTLRFFKDGEALHAAFDAIRLARKRVCLEVYIFHSDATGRAFANLLAHKAREGLAVYLVYDAVGCIDSHPRIFEHMAAAGVRLAAFHPIKPWECRYSWRPFNRDHRKLLVIDDDTAGLGGLNIGGEYAGSWVVPSSHGRGPWRDNAVGLRGPAARLLLFTFARMWRYLQHGGKLRTAEVLHNIHEGEFGVLATTPTRASPLVPLRHMLQEAKSSILMTMSYFAPPDELIEDLCRAARRKVRVRLMLPGICDLPLLLLAARSFYETLLGAGVEIYERQGAVLHAKTMCIDGHTTVLGSTNFDHRSIEYNCELSVVIRNERFGEQMHQLFEHDVAHARQILLSEWRSRPLRDRIVQWAVKRARYLL